MLTRIPRDYILLSAGKALDSYKGRERAGLLASCEASHGMHLSAAHENPPVYVCVCLCEIDTKKEGGREEREIAGGGGGQRARERER